MNQTEARVIFLLSGRIEYRGQWYEQVLGPGCKGCSFTSSERCLAARTVFRGVIQGRVCNLAHGSWQPAKSDESSSS